MHDTIRMMTFRSHREASPSGPSKPAKRHSLLAPFHNLAQHMRGYSGKHFRLLNLPDELLLCVADCLETGNDINSLSRVNRHLHTLLNSYLYRHNVQHSGSSALFWAAMKGEAETARMLLKQGAKVNIKSSKLNLHPRSYGQVTPLWLATYEGHLQTAKVLLEGNANPEASDRPTHNTPLHLAATRGYEDIVSLLLQQPGINADPRNRKGKTPLFCAATHGFHKIVKRLLDMDDVNINTNASGPTPLMSAMTCDHSQVVDLLLQHPSINLGPQSPQRRWECTPLSLATSLSQTLTIKHFLQKNVDVNAREPTTGSTALLHAISNKHAEIVKLLLDHGADVNIFYPAQNGTPLIEACRHSNIQIIALLLNAGAEVNAQGGLYGNALQAASCRSVPAAKLLLLKGADVHAASGFYASALHAAVDAGFEELVQTYLDMGAKVNSCDQNGGTALHSAVYCGYLDIVKTLIDRGADVDAICERQGSVLNTAMTGWSIYGSERGHEEVVGLLIEKGARDGGQRGEGLGMIW